MADYRAVTRPNSCTTEGERGALVTSLILPCALESYRETLEWKKERNKRKIKKKRESD